MPTQNDLKMYNCYLSQRTHAKEIRETLQLNNEQYAKLRYRLHHSLLEAKGHYSSYCLLAASTMGLTLGPEHDKCDGCSCLCHYTAEDWAKKDKYWDNIISQQKGNT